MTPREPQDQGQWPIILPQPQSFFKTPLCDDLEKLDAQVAFIGMPFDQGTFGRPGARYGPGAVRDVPRGHLYADPMGAQREAEGIFDIDAGTELLKGVTMADCGDITVVPSDVAGNFDKLTRAVEQVASRGALPVIVGGDHAITFPAVRGLSRFGPLNLVHFDAHMDYTHDVQGVFHTHGNPIRRCFELPFVDHISSLGIRRARRRQYEEFQADGNLIITPAKFRQLGPGRVVDLIPRGENLYITLDIDVLDPSQAPGTGTPAIGGLRYEELRECLRELISRHNLVAFDLVEVAPAYDSSQITAQVASQLIFDILAARFPPD